MMLVLADGHGGQVEGSSTCSTTISATLATLPGLQLLSPSCVPGLSELATLASLLVLQPSYLLSHLPPEMHAIGGALAAALQAADRVVGAAGDRGGLLVSQDVIAAVAAVVKTSSSRDTANLEPEQTVADNSSSEGLLQDWMQRVTYADEAGMMAAVSQLLPHHESLTAATSQADDGTSSNQNCSVHELDDTQVLLLRLKQLHDWSSSQQYRDMMAAAKPLRRVLPPTARKLPSG